MSAIFVGVDVSKQQHKRVSACLKRLMDQVIADSAREEHRTVTLMRSLPGIGFRCFDDIVGRSRWRIGPDGWPRFPVLRRRRPDHQAER